MVSNLLFMGMVCKARDFIFVKDTISNIIRLFSVIDKGDIVNISSQNEIKIKDLDLKNFKIKWGMLGILR